MTEQLTAGGIAAVKAGNSTDPVVLQVIVISAHNQHQELHETSDNLQEQCMRTHSAVSSASRASMSPASHVVCSLACTQRHHSKLSICRPCSVGIPLAHHTHVHLATSLGLCFRKLLTTDSLAFCAPCSPCLPCSNAGGLLAASQAGRRQV